MPYQSTSALPDQTKSLSAKQKRAFKQAFNSAYKERGEESAFKIAWAAAKQAGGEVDKREVKVKQHERDGQIVRAHVRRLTDSAEGDETENALLDVLSADESEGALKRAALALGLGVGAVAALRWGAPLIVPFHRSTTWQSAATKASNHPMFGFQGALDTLDGAGSGFAVFSKKAYAGLQGDDLASTLMNVERFIKGKPIEHAFVINNKTGEIVSAFRGTEMNFPVAMPFLMPARARQGYTMTHNHPISVPYSGADLMSQSVTKVSELRAVLPDGSISAMRYRHPVNPVSAARQKANVAEHGKREGQWLIDAVGEDIATKAALGNHAPLASWFRNPANNLRYREFMDDAYEEFVKNNSAWERVFMEGVVKRRDTIPEFDVRKTLWSTPDGLATLIKTNPEYVAKHLIGRHDQKDHDPTKHSRAQHKDMVRPNVERAGLAGTLTALSGGAALKRGAQPTTRMLYGLYALNFAIGTADAASQARAVSKAKDKTIEDVLEKLSDASGITPKQLLEDLGAYMLSNKITHPTKDDIHEFMIESYGHEVSKHLIGRHQQKDHDPTKQSNRTHARGQHQELGRKMNHGSKKARETLYPSGVARGQATDIAGGTAAAMTVAQIPAAVRFGRNWHQMARAGGHSGRGYPVPVQQQTLKNIKETRQRAQSNLEEARRRFEDYMRGTGKTTVATGTPTNPVWAGTTPSPFLPVRR